MEKAKEFLKRKNVNITLHAYLIDALGAMAFGLFASLLIGTIFETLGNQTGIQVFLTVAGYAKAATGAALGIAIAHALNAPQLVLFSAATVGLAGNDLGGPVGALVSTIIAAELGKIVSKETRLDILVTPGTTIISGVLAAQFIGPGVSGFMAWFGDLVKTATQMQPFLMGVLVSALIGIALTLPISSAAICIALSLDGLAGGAATAGCCAQMIGFAFMSWQENKVGGLLAQGLGTSMLQMGNIVHNPRIWIPPTVVSMITGPLATMVFRLENIPAGSGMGTCGLVGPIGVFTAMGGGVQDVARHPLRMFPDSRRPDTHPGKFSSEDRLDQGRGSEAGSVGSGAAGLGPQVRVRGCRFALRQIPSRSNCSRSFRASSRVFFHPNRCMSTRISSDTRTPSDSSSMRCISGCSKAAAPVRRP